MTRAEATRADRRWARRLLGAAVLGAVLWWTGTGPLVDGVGALDPATLALGAAIAVPTTVACAWRWQLVARGLGVRVELGPAVASCYRAQLLNTTLPGGILGDVHRGVRHGRDTGDVARALRAVAWERVAGQVVLVEVAAAGLVLLPSPLRPPAPVGLAALALLTAALLSLAVTAPASRAAVDAPVRRLLRAVHDDVRHGPLARGAWPGVVLASIVAVAGYAATYVVAARAVGVSTSSLSTAGLLPVVLLVLLAAGLPVNVAGWGPREGMAAWAFGAAGLGADVGVATAVAYGVMVLVASLPGAVVALVVSARVPEGAPARG